MVLLTKTLCLKSVARPITPLTAPRPRRQALRWECSRPQLQPLWGRLRGNKLTGTVNSQVWRGSLRSVVSSVTRRGVNLVLDPQYWQRGRRNALSSARESDFGCRVPSRGRHDKGNGWQPVVLGWVSIRINWIVSIMKCKRACVFTFYPSLLLFEWGKNTFTPENIDSSCWSCCLQTFTSHWHEDDGEKLLYRPEDRVWELHLYLCSSILVE